jgi:hypothetical protein
MADDRLTSDSGDAERDRVTQELAGRLFARGIDVREDDDSADVSDMEEAVLRFEARVIALGGDLMVDEPPRGQAGQPDDPSFRLPLRADDETAQQYIERLSRATDQLRDISR